ncbi:MAG: uracil-DNA glycosylase [Balneolaceae bacterium]|nr:uracil-DNA glycosylase [Balneolaceae bacterium]MBO6546333.1 uracil-DNA glycosylase [Balneolaceae bacterium]MBO6648692.1 uracil-DNA glycosylase [Balneolaceae bacterium]
MSETNPQNLIERAQKLLKQQSDLFGPFNVDIVSTTPDSEKSPASVNVQVNPMSNKPEVNEDPEIYQPDEEAKPKSKLELISQSSTLEELRALCEQAEELRTDLENTNLVFGVGNPSADLMIIGEAPGMNEDVQGEPFVGQAGQLLDKIMKAIDFDRSDIYIANILKHRPPNNRDPKPEERERSLPYLLRQIELVNPKLILCVGRVSATTLLGKDDSLKNLRKKFHPFLERELMATYHPAALLRNEKWKRPTWEDVQMLRDRYNALGGKP